MALWSLCTQWPCLLSFRGYFLTFFRIFPKIAKIENFRKKNRFDERPFGNKND